MSWKWEYIILILVSTIADYYCARKINQSSHPKTRKVFLSISIFFNLSILFFFKYFEFFISSITQLASIEYASNFAFLLPVGISFYTFQTMSYTIDVYNKKVDVESHFGRFALFVTFFPQLVAGPIERANHLMGQLKSNLSYNAHSLLPAAKLFLWGLFKKVVIADRVALIINPVYNNPSDFGSPMLIVATVLFAFQIYCDFSGYSDMAIGIARTFNVKLNMNFNTPYFSASISEFWKKWHISLSSWFRDYVYIPLGGNMVIKWRWYYNLFITFLVSGLWHGANWTFIAWGAYHGLLLIAERIFPKITNVKFIRIIWTFILVNIGWIFFRANTLNDVWAILNSIATNHKGSFTTQLIATGISKLNVLVTMAAIGVLILKEANQWKTNFAVKLTFYLFLVFSIIIFGINESSPFIYFQF